MSEYMVEYYPLNRERKDSDTTLVESFHEAQLKVLDIATSIPMCHVAVVKSKEAGFFYVNDRQVGYYFVWEM